VNVLAVVVAGGSRSGADPIDVLSPVGGVPMLVRSVRGVLAAGVVDHVMISGGDRTAEFLHVCAGLPVRAWQPRHDGELGGAHSPQRPGTTRGDGTVAQGFDEVVLVHDGARPLAPPALFGAVLEAVRNGHDAVVPVLPLTDTVKVVDTGGLLRGTPDRAGLRVVQTPQAFRAPDIHFGLLDAGAAYMVVGDPLAFAVRTPWDLELAELLVEEAI